MKGTLVNQFVIKALDPTTGDWDLWLDSREMTANELIKHTKTFFGKTAMKRYSFALFQRLVKPGRADEFVFVRRINRLRKIKPVKTQGDKQ